MSPTPPPFSAHARGVPLFDRARLLDAPRHLARLLLAIRDSASSGLWMLPCQGWLTLISAFVTVVSVIFFHFFFPGRDLYVQLSWTPVSFSVILPVVLYGCLAWLRRERCLQALAELKVATLSVHTLYHDWSDLDPRSSPCTLAMRALCSSTHEYLTTPRFTSAYFPYWGFREAMAQVARARGAHVRATRAALRAAHAGCTDLRAPPTALAPALEAHLHKRIEAVGLALEELSNAKEYRTPLGIRSTSRFYVALIIPLFWGPYGAWVAEQADFGFAFFFAGFLSISLAAVLNVLISLEDPFDNTGMDGVFVPEHLGEILSEMDAADEAYTAGDAASHGLSGAAALAAAPSGDATLTDAEPGELRDDPVTQA